MDKTEDYVARERKTLVTYEAPTEKELREFKAEQISDDVKCFTCSPGMTNCCYITTVK